MFEFFWSVFSFGSTRPGRWSSHKMSHRISRVHVGLPAHTLLQKPPHFHEKIPRVEKHGIWVDEGEKKREMLGSRPSEPPALGALTLHPSCPRSCGPSLFLGLAPSRLPAPFLLVPTHLDTTLLGRSLLSRFSFGLYFSFFFEHFPFFIFPFFPCLFFSHFLFLDFSLIFAFSSFFIFPFFFIFLRLKHFSIFSFWRRNPNTKLVWEPILPSSKPEPAACSQRWEVHVFSSSQ